LTWLSSQYWAPNLKKMVIFEFSKKKNRAIRVAAAYDGNVDTIIMHCIEIFQTWDQKLSL